MKKLAWLPVTNPKISDNLLKNPGKLCKSKPTCFLFSPVLAPIYLNSFFSVPAALPQTFKAAPIFRKRVISVPSALPHPSKSAPICNKSFFSVPTSKLLPH